MLSRFIFKLTLSVLLDNDSYDDDVEALTGVGKMLFGYTQNGLRRVTADTEALNVIVKFLA